MAVKTIRISDNSGNPLTGQITMNNTFRIDADFVLPNNTVHAGDTTTVTLPDYILFDNSVTEFDLKDQNNQVAAKAKRQGNKLVVTYNSYVENKSDVSGSFYFAVRFNGTQHQAPGKYKLDFDVSGTKIEAGEVDYTGTADLPKSGLAKYRQTKKNAENTIEYFLDINRYGKDLPNAVVVDNLDVPDDAAVSGKILENTIRVRKGAWVYDSVKKSWDLQNAVFVTPQKIELSNDNRTLRVELGHVQATEGYQILYDIKMDYDLLPGEVIKNDAIMTADSEPGAKAQFPVAYTDAGGQANGYNYTIQVHKIDGLNNNSLPGAEFEVIREATGQGMGTIIIGEDGTGSITGLLRTTYIIKEIQAPSGYKLMNEDIIVTERDFEADKIARITVKNEKEPQPADVVIKAKKVFKNDDGTEHILQAGEFTFDLKDDQGRLLIPRAMMLTEM